MKRFKNILLVAGGKGWEETTLKRAVTLAKNNKAKRKHVLKPLFLKLSSLLDTNWRIGKSMIQCNIKGIFFII